MTTDLYVAEQIANLDQKTAVQVMLANQQALYNAAFGRTDENPLDVELFESQIKSVGYGNKQTDIRQKHSTLAGTTHTAVGPLNELAFFRDCKLDAPIMNTVLNPMGGLLNLLDVRPSTVDNIKRGFLTRLGDPQGTLTPAARPATHCDPPQIIDDTINACMLEHPFNLLATRSKTMDINTLIERACREGCFDEFFFVGGARGSSSVPSDEMLGNTDVMQAGAVRFQMWRMARSKEYWAHRQIWSGSPPQNQAQGAGYKESIGLANLISNSYGNPTGTALEGRITGTPNAAACAALNSDVKNFGACIGANNAQGRNIFTLLQELEDTLYMRAMHMQLLPVEWVLVMSSVHWHELLKVLPCEMIGDGCSGASVAGNVRNTLVSDAGGLANMVLREQLARNMSITLNGRSYPVLIDDAIPYTFTTATNQYDSSIYFIPIRAGGQLVTYIEHKDYSRIGGPNDILSPIPGSQTDLRGWSDGGRFHWLVQRNYWCFELVCKTEFRVIMGAPHLAGRIDNVRACPIQTKPINQIFAPTATT